ncbi:MAG TPA: GYD domain-containing protein [Candidatus Sulfotelmatobacter sp.]|nr:GYD domain-containing protein [Candidatus Sulfotelmatobacter sp.]
MPHYISLIRYTQKGVENLKDSPKRLEATRKAFEAAGGKLTAIYWTLGQYDAVAIGELTEGAAGLRVNLAGAMQGYIRSETLQAFTEEEFRKAVAALP